MDIMYGYDIILCVFIIHVFSSIFCWFFLGEMCFLDTLFVLKRFAFECLAFRVNNKLFTDIQVYTHIHYIIRVIETWGITRVKSPWNYPFWTNYVGFLSRFLYTLSFRHLMGKHANSGVLPVHIHYVYTHLGYLWNILVKK